MLTLEEIGRQYKTDKLEHGYLRHYEARFAPLRDLAPTVLEIGTWEGASVKTWRDYFAKGKIVGIDHAPEWMPGPEDRILVEIGKQEDREFQEDFARRHGPFHVIIDDGGHQPHQHLISLEVLWKHVVPGGWYAIEDLHSIFNPCWNPTMQARTILDWIREQGQSVLVGGSDVAEVHIVGGNWNDGLVFLRKRRLDERYTPEH